MILQMVLPTKRPVSHNLTMVTTSFFAPIYGPLILIWMNRIQMSLEVGEAIKGAIAALRPVAGEDNPLKCRVATDRAAQVRVGARIHVGRGIVCRVLESRVLLDDGTGWLSVMDRLRLEKNKCGMLKVK